MKKIAGRGGHHQSPRVEGHTPAEIRLSDHQPKVEKGGREREATMAAVVWRRSRAQLMEVARTGDLPLQIDASHCRDKEQRGTGSTRPRVPARTAPPASTSRRTGERGIFNYLPLFEMALLEMGLLGLVLRFCHRLSSGATHLGLLVTWQATSPIQRGIGRGNDPRALPLSFTIPRRLLLPTVARFYLLLPFPSLFTLAADAAAAACRRRCLLPLQGSNGTRRYLNEAWIRIVRGMDTGAVSSIW
jgi:hypothetical protein